MLNNILIVVGIICLAAQALAFPNLRRDTTEQGNVAQDPKPPVHGNNTWGDLLNITQCFCETEAKNRWGFYLQADYENFHNGRRYQVRQVCNDDKHSGGVPHCWSEEPVKKVTTCDEDGDRNRFCFNRDYHVHHSFFKTNRYDDKYWFNDQERKLDESHPQARPAPEECEGMCDTWLDGMTAPKLGEDQWGVLIDVGKGNHAVRLSDKVVYTDLDDMCWNCQ